MMRIYQKLRQDDRLARVLKGGLSGVMGKATTLLANAVSLPLAVRYLGPQRYGAWVTISTTIVMFTIMDLGIAYALTNFISRANARDDLDAARRYYAAAFWLSACISAAGGLIAICLWPAIDWSKLFHLHDAALAHEISLSVAIALAFLLASLPLNLVHQVLGGYQQTQITNYFNIIRNVLSLASVVIVIERRGSLLMLTAIYSSSLMAATIALNLWLNYRDRRRIRPSLKIVRRPEVSHLLRTGAGFFVLQIAGLIVFNSDNLVIAHYLGAAEVAPYSVAWRLAALTVVLHTSFASSLWPAYAEAYARGDLVWVRRTFWRMARVVSFTIVPGLIVLAIFGRTLLNWYVGPAATPGYPLLWAICGWTIISAFMDVEACLLAAVGRIRAQGILSLIAACINLLLSIYLVQRIGSIGVVLGTAISYVLVLIVPQTLIVWNVLYPDGATSLIKGRARQAIVPQIHRLNEALLLCGFRSFVFMGRKTGLLPCPPVGTSTRQRLLVIHLTPHLGDSVMLMPLLEQLRRAQPNAELALAVGRPVAPMFRQLPWLDGVYVVDSQLAGSTSLRASSPMRIWNVLRAYRRTMSRVSADICIFPRWNDDMFRSQYLGYLIGSKRRIGWRSDSFRYCDTLLTERYTGGSGMHEAERFCLLASSAELAAHAHKPKIDHSTLPSMQQIAAAVEWPALADRLSIDCHMPFALIAPGASSAVRQWPLNRWLGVIDWIRERHLEIVLVCGPADADVAHELYTIDQKRATLIDSTTSILELAALTAQAALFVGNDSGPGHVAGSLGVPSLVVFSSPEGCDPDIPTGPIRSRPAGPRVAFCQPEKSIAPCDQYCRAKRAHCIEGVSVESFLSRLEVLWQEKRAPAAPSSMMTSQMQRQLDMTADHAALL